MTDLSEQERAAKAAENERLTKEANDLAFAARQRDLASGQKPLVTDVAESVMEKLKRQFPPDKAYDGGAGEGNPGGDNSVPTA